jgi:hypothetical protein
VRGGAAEAAGNALAGIGATAGLFAGPLVRGTIGSAIGAALGGVIWAMIAISTHYEIGYVAVLVGAMSGMGMFIGVRDPSALGGAIAAGMAALSIVIAKASIVLYLFGGAGEIPIADLLFAIVRYSDPMDILFYILAIGAAYGAATKIAAGRVGRRRYGDPSAGGGTVAAFGEAWTVRRAARVVHVQRAAPARVARWVSAFQDRIEALALSGLVGRDNVRLDVPALDLVVRHLPAGISKPSSAGAGTTSVQLHTLMTSRWGGAGSSSPAPRARGSVMASAAQTATTTRAGFLMAGLRDNVKR